VLFRVTADEQRHALATEAARRGLTLPAAFDVPDRTLWEGGMPQRLDERLKFRRVPSMTL
jgi:hypothetical protein